MDHRIPRIGAVISVLLAVGALVTFIFLNGKFEGPDPVGSLISSPFEITARFDTVKTLPTKQPVLHKGVRVGRVRSVAFEEREDPKTGEKIHEGVVTFALDDNILPVYENAKLTIGERSLLGDAYLNLLDRGDPKAGELEEGDELSGVGKGGNVVEPVNFDQALDFLDREGKDRVKSLIGTLGDGAAPEGNDLRLNDSIGGIARTLIELNQLTSSLHGQEQEIGALVRDSSTVLTELGDREAALRRIVASGRTTLDALGANTESLQQGLEELPRLLGSGRTALARIRPLLSEARPLVAELREIAPDLALAFREDQPFSIGPISTDLIEIIEGLQPQREASEQVLPLTETFNRRLNPVLELAAPASFNAVTIARYLAPRSNSIAAFFALGRSLAKPEGPVAGREDESSHIGRFFGILDPNLGADGPSNAYSQPDGVCDQTQSFCYNAYPGPDDALDNQPFGGTYPRLMPYEPPPPQSVLKGR